MTKPLENKTILVADDDAINQFVVKHALAILGAKVEAANNGDEAVEKMKSNEYSLVLMDIQMPGMTGYEATKFIRQQLKNNTPIIAMTAFALNGEEEKCIQCGMNGYISKPFTTEKLSTTIDKILSSPIADSVNSYLLSNDDIAIDISILYDVAGNDNEYIRLMLSTFIKNMPITLQKIQQAVSNQNWEEVFKTAHYAKSSLSIIKVDKMFTTVLQLEKNAKSKTNLEKIPEDTLSLISMYEKAEQLILKYLEA